MIDEDFTPTAYIVTNSINQFKMCGLLREMVSTSLALYLKCHGSNLQHMQCVDI